MILSYNLCGYKMSKIDLNSLSPYILLGLGVCKISLINAKDSDYEAYFLLF